MSGTSGPPGQSHRLPPALSRRGFIRVASVAGAAALGGCARHGVRRGAVDTPGDAQPAGPKLTAKAAADPPRPTCVARVDDGKFATCDDAGSLTLWKINESGSVTRDETFPKQHVGKATFITATFPWVLTAGYDGTVFVRNLQDNTSRRFTKHQQGKKSPEVWVVAVAQNGTVLSATNEGHILQWDAALGDDSPLTHYMDHDRDDPVGGLAFVPPPVPGQPAPTRFLSTHSHGDVNLWTIGKADHPDKTFSHRNSHHVNSVAVSGDGTRFVSAGFDMTPRVWNLNDDSPNPQPEGRLKGHKSWVWRVAISPDGTKAASASRDGTVRLWNVQPSIDDNRRMLKGPPEVGPRGSMAVAFVNSKFLVYTTNHLDNVNDQVRVFEVSA